LKWYPMRPGAGGGLEFIFYATSQKSGNSMPAAGLRP
jgi:hypothetical protein